jgi:hypothetical protein
MLGTFYNELRQGVVLLKRGLLGVEAFELNA